MLQISQMQQFLFGFLLIFVRKISYVLSNAEAPCNRTCGSTTVKYPFGFSASCPYRLDTDCSGSGDLHLKGFKVLDFTDESVIIDPWNRNHSPTQCYQQLDILSDFKQQFALTGRNVFLLGENCTEPVCTLDVSTLIDVVYKDGSGRKNCTPVDSSRNHTCISMIGQKWVPWKNLEDSNCKDMMSSMIYEGKQNSSISFKVNEIDLAWWMNGTCQTNSCSANANCTKFRNPNTNKMAHRCKCLEGFVGDGFLQGSGCQKGSACNASGYLSAKCGKKSIVVVIICLAIAVLAVFLVFKRGSSALKKKRSARRLLSIHGGTVGLTIPIYTYKQMQKATNGFSENEKLGSGGFGTVYAGKLPSKPFVAVKKLKYMDSHGMERVLNEINVLSAVDHPNLLRLLGCCLEQRGEPILVYEFMPNGTLGEHLQRQRGDGLQWRTRIQIAAQTARALAYLHSVNPPIYHRDIKSSNILLDYDLNAKVADFGLSRLILSEDSHISTTPQGTPGYLDPQYHQNFHLSDKSDVYSFGVVLVEIISALKVVDFSRDKGEINLAWLANNKISAGCVHEIVDPFLQMNKNPHVERSVHRVAELAFRCLAFDKDARPCMAEVAEELNSTAHDYDDDNGVHSHLEITSVMNVDESRCLDRPTPSTEWCSRQTSASTIASSSQSSASTIPTASL
uniref:Protein kinase domain-containing protein n=1 Tax=Araucaria cunninghamii TaxID=56994 RepID=A0A0D6QYW1_ARACU